MPYVILMFAVLAETIGTTALQASQQFTKPLPSASEVSAYGIERTQNEMPCLLVPSYAPTSTLDLQTEACCFDHHSPDTEAPQVAQCQ